MMDEENDDDDILVELVQMAIRAELKRKLRPRRRRTTKEERYQKCNWCGYPISHRHHLLPVARYGENESGIPLCPNCHELYHIVFDAFVLGKQRALDIWAWLSHIEWEPKRLAHAEKVIEVVRRFMKGEKLSIPSGHYGRFDDAD